MTNRADTGVASKPQDRRELHTAARKGGYRPAKERRREGTHEFVIVGRVENVERLHARFEDAGAQTKSSGQPQVHIGVRISLASVPGAGTGVVLRRPVAVVTPRDVVGPAAANDA